MVLISARFQVSKLLRTFFSRQYVIKVLEMYLLLSLVKALYYELTEACARLHDEGRQVAACSPSCTHQTHGLSLQYVLSEKYFCTKSMIHNFKIETFQQEESCSQNKNKNLPPKFQSQKTL